MYLPVRQESAAQSAADSNHTEIGQPMTTAESLLAQCHGMTVVTQSHSQTEPVAQHGSKRYHTMPRHVGGIFYASGLEVSARRWYPDGTHFVHTAIILYQVHNPVTKRNHIRIDVGVVYCTENILGYYVATNVYYGISGGFNTYIDSYYFVFLCSV